MKVQRNKKGQWFYDFTFGDRRYRVITGLTKADTEKAMHEKIERLKKEKHGIIEDAPVQEPVLFADFAQDFIELYSKVERRPNTTLSHENSLKRLNEFFKGKSLQDITPELVERYKAARRAQVSPARHKHVSPATVNRELACLRAICRKAVKWGKIKADPMADVAKFKEDNVKERILTNEEMTRLVNCAGSHLRPVLVIALNTAMRRGEILGLRWENVNFRDRFILIESGEAKSGKSRKVPMNDLVIETLKAIPRKSEKVFGVKDVKTSFHTACRKAKIKGFRLHDARHTALSKMVEAGVDIVTVSKIAGHSSIQMTMRYCHPTSENMQRAVEVLESIFKNQAQVGKNPVIKADDSEVEIPVSHSFIYH